MENLIVFLSDNGKWLFGSGGLAALVLALVKRSKSGGPAAGNHVIAERIVGDLVGGNKTTVNKSGFGALEFGFAVALIVTAIGAVFVFVGPTVTAMNGSAVIQGDGNTTTVIGSDTD